MSSRRPLAILLATLFCVGCLGGDPPVEEEPPLSWSANLIPMIAEDGTTPVTANIRALDVNGDGADEVVFTEPIAGRLGWLEADCEPMACEPEMHEDLGAPVRTALGDLDGDGAAELIIADIGILHPTNAREGRVLTLQDGELTVLAEGLGRTVCAEPADLDGDGDLDLTLCEFGHDEGSVSWLEQTAEGNWTQHIIDARPGAIHALPADMDGDGDVDIVATVSQMSEDIMLYRNDGNGSFHSTVLFDATETWHGMSGLRLIDLNGDGDLDILYTNGDTMDFDTPDGVDPNQLHGLAWLENDGFGGFTHRDLVRNWGAYDIALTDVDGDHDMDILLVCMQTEGQFPEDTERHEVVLLESTASGWQRHDVHTGPPHRMLTIAVVGDALWVGGHDPLGQGGELHRLAQLELVLDAVA